MKFNYKYKIFKANLIQLSLILINLTFSIKPKENHTLYTRERRLENNNVTRNELLFCK